MSASQAAKGFGWSMKINEIFYTVQGEGRNAGRAALFIRLPYCNLSCAWCDTEFDSFDEVSDEDLRAQLKDCPGRFAVITGGEPSMNKQTPELIRMLKEEGYEIAMESNGQFPVPEGVDFLTVAPKRWNTKSGAPGERPAFWWDTRNQPSELKLVVDDETPMTIADDMMAAWKRGEFQFRNDGEPAFYLSPEWGGREKIIPRLVTYLQENPKWRISIQSHKILNVR